MSRDFLAVIPFLGTFCIPTNPPDSDVRTTGATCGSFSHQQMELGAGCESLTPHCPEILLPAKSSHHTEWTLLAVTGPDF